MKLAYTNAQARLADQNAAACGISAQVLMERAGAALADRVRAALQTYGDCVFVCGGGNNGGDGFTAAEILRGEGYEVAVLCLAERFSPLCGAAKARYRGEILGKIPRRRYAVTVDCLFGTGFSKEISGENAALVDFVNGGDYVIACDLPSGLQEGGVARGAHVEADETVAMGQLKCALLLSDGADCAGRISVADLGIAAEGGAQVWEDGDVSAFFPKKRSNSHKGSYGTAHIFAGGALGGAAFLSAAACLKSGAGYTKLSVTKEYFPYIVGRMPAVVLKEFQAIDGEMLSADCIALGMGSGVSERLYAYLAELLTVYTGTLVLDADALNTAALYGTDLLKHKTCKVVITPHPKEFSRLTGKPTETLLSDPLRYAREFSEEYGATVVFKNNRTVIAQGDRAAVNVTGTPALAKGGSGDVLAGFLAGTIARGVPPFEAACVSCYILGRAGEIAAQRVGEYACDPCDVVSALPAAIGSVVR